MLPSKNTKEQGLSILEVLITLSIIGLAVSMASFNSSPRLSKAQLQSRISDVGASITLGRVRALRSGQAIKITVPQASCFDANDNTQEITIGRDGSIEPVRLCFESLNERIRFDVHPITAALVQVP